jgi:hypothetical protein
VDFTIVLFEDLQQIASSPEIRCLNNTGGIASTLTIARPATTLLNVLNRVLMEFELIGNSIAIKQ